MYYTIKYAGTTEPDETTGHWSCRITNVIDQSNKQFLSRSSALAISSLAVKLTPDIKASGTDQPQTSMGPDFKILALRRTPPNNRGLLHFIQALARTLVSAVITDRLTLHHAGFRRRLRPIHHPGQGGQNCSARCEGDNSDPSIDAGGWGVTASGRGAGFRGRGRPFLFSTASVTCCSGFSDRIPSDWPPFRSYLVRCAGFQVIADHRRGSGWA